MSSRSARQIIKELVEFAMGSDPPEPHDPDKGQSHKGVYHQLLTQHGYVKDYSDKDRTHYGRTNEHPTRKDRVEDHAIILHHKDNSKLVSNWEHNSSSGGGGEGRSASYLQSYLSKIHKD
jgi:hypothetical protein